VQQVREILAADIAEVESKKLASYLSHPDRRVRQKSQLELADRGAGNLLVAAATSGESLIERLHGIWGLDHLARTKPDAKNEAVATWMSLASDDEVEIRAHSVRLLGELGGDDANQVVLKSLSDSNARVRYFGLVSARKLAIKEAFETVVAELETNAGRDPVLRHGAIMALTEVTSPDEIAKLKTHPSVHVRLGAVVALRRLQSTLVGQYLADEDELVVAEAARAIHDAPIDEAMGALASLISKPTQNESIIRRVLDANFRVGKLENAEAIARFAADLQNALELRQQALEMLADWESPSGRDRVTGMWRPKPSKR
jgi:quinoprotein glucose dehydrogenase